jgi:hypothetical protein
MPVGPLLRSRITVPNRNTGSCSTPAARARPEVDDGRPDVAAGQRQRPFGLRPDLLIEGGVGQSAQQRGGQAQLGQHRPHERRGPPLVKVAPGEVLLRQGCAESKIRFPARRTAVPPPRARAATGPARSAGAGASRWCGRPSTRAGSGCRSRWPSSATGARSGTSWSCSPAASSCSRASGVAGRLEGRRRLPAPMPHEPDHRRGPLALGLPTGPGPRRPRVCRSRPARRCRLVGRAGSVSSGRCPRAAR